jgi:hypothetical protein
LLYSLLHSPVPLSHPGPNIFFSTPFSNTYSLCSSLSVRDQASHPNKTTGMVTVMYILPFCYMGFIIVRILTWYSKSTWHGIISVCHWTDILSVMVIILYVEVCATASFFYEAYLTSYL